MCISYWFRQTKAKIRFFPEIEFFCTMTDMNFLDCRENTELPTQMLGFGVAVYQLMNGG